LACFSPVHFLLFPRERMAFIHKRKMCIWEAVIGSLSLFPSFIWHLSVNSSVGGIGCAVVCLYSVWQNCQLSLFGHFSSYCICKIAPKDMRNKIIN
jgi:hypothetical protein